MTKQCPSCGGICKPSGCEQENVNQTWWHEPAAKMNYRQWQGLTDEEREWFKQRAHPDIIEALELKLKWRNT